MKTEGSGKSIGEPDYEPSVKPDPEDAAEESQRIEVLFALLHGVWYRVEL
jgi:hypothetical protein